MALNIPPSQRKSLQKLATLSRDDADRLLTALQTAKPAISSRALAVHIADKVGVPLDDLQGIVLLLLSLFFTHAQSKVPLKRLVNDVAKSAAEIGPELQTAEAIMALKERLLAMLSVKETLGITSKAADVMIQHKHPFSSARILTDIRPIFSTEHDLTPVAGVIVHNLQIKTSSEDRQARTHFIAMDSRDLTMLRQVVDRAMRKEKQLKKLIQSTALAHIEVE